MARAITAYLQERKRQGSLRGKQVGFRAGRCWRAEMNAWCFVWVFLPLLFSPFPSHCCESELCHYSLKTLRLMAA